MGRRAPSSVEVWRSTQARMGRTTRSTSSGGVAGTSSGTVILTSMSKPTSSGSLCVVVR